LISGDEGRNWKDITYHFSTGNSSHYGNGIFIIDENAQFAIKITANTQRTYRFVKKKGLTNKISQPFSDSF